MRKVGLKTRYWGPFRQYWFSICSGHWKYDESCRLCIKGVWRNYWRQNIEHLFFKLFPNLWIKWANRNNKSKMK